jgi:hypothetical protein
MDPRDGPARRELLGRWTPHVGENDADADGYSEQEKLARSPGGFSQGGVRKVPKVPEVPVCLGAGAKPLECLIFAGAEGADAEGAHVGSTLRHLSHQRTLVTSTQAP